MKKIACIGTGAMGGAIMRADCNKFDPNNITVSNRTLEKGKSFANETGCRFADNNKDCIKDAKYIFIAVKPAFLSDLFAEIKNDIPSDAVIISMAYYIFISYNPSIIPIFIFFIFTTIIISSIIIKIYDKIPAFIHMRSKDIISLDMFYSSKIRYHIFRTNAYAPFFLFILFWHD